MTFDREEYARQCKIVRNTPLYRATCPPEDELGSLRDSAIEDIAEDKLQEAISDPDYMMEFILENSYDQSGFREMAVALSAMMDAVTNPVKTGDKFARAHHTRLVFADAMREFIEMKATSLAEVEFDD